MEKNEQTVLRSRSALNFFYQNELGYLNVLFDNKLSLI